ncbi:CPBP family intramembrane metalloprotease [Candidatus Gottesmanbacteria bacterium]|nr:CPBP family intramembrane metalloprotease [Candidatus Gottesmanbacteria bacterium]
MVKKKPQKKAAVQHISEPTNLYDRIEPVLRVWAWIAIVWMIYRYFFRFSEWTDEFVFKPLVFAAPVIWYVLKKEKRRLDSIGITFTNFYTSLYIGLGFGFVFALEGLAANVMKYGKIQIRPIGAFDQNGMIGLLILSLATAVTEEILNRGFIFSRLYEKMKNLPASAILSGCLFVGLHVPILVTALHLQGVTLVLFFVTTFILGVVNALLFANTGSLVAPILIHIFWNMTVALYL